MNQLLPPAVLIRLLQLELVLVIVAVALQRPVLGALKAGAVDLALDLLPREMSETLIDAVLVPLCLDPKNSERVRDYGEIAFPQLPPPLVPPNSAPRQLSSGTVVNTRS